MHARELELLDGDYFLSRSDENTVGILPVFQKMTLSSDGISPAASLFIFAASLRIQVRLCSSNGLSPIFLSSFFMFSNSHNETSQNFTDFREEPENPCLAPTSSFVVVFKDADFDKVHDKV